jgi:hypothetical protein
MSTFLAKWANAAPRPPAGKPPVPSVACQANKPGGDEGITPDACVTSPTAKHRENEPDLAISGVEWAAWKAAALNRIFQEQGITAQPGRITAPTVRHGGETSLEKGPAKGAVVCDNNLAMRSAQLDRIDLCARCGPTEWRWTGAAWICSGCGAPARKERAGKLAAAVDSTRTDEQPMSRAEATK